MGEYEIEDMVGNTVRAGNYVCHVTRHGCHMSFDRRLVIEVKRGHIITEWTNYDDKVRRTAVSKNFVRVP